MNQLKALSGFSKCALFFVALFALLYAWIPVSQLIAPDPDVPSQPLMIVRSHSTRAPFHELWSVEGFRDFSGAGRLVPGVVMLLFVAAFYVKGGLGRRERWLPLFIAPVAFLFFWYYRVSFEKNALFGDGPKLPEQVELGMVFPAEVMMMRLFNGVYQHAHHWWGFNGREAIQFTGFLLGGAFAAAMALLAQTLTASRPLRVLFVLGSVGAGFAILFLGYIETTVLEAAMMGWFFASAAKLIFRDGPPDSLAARTSPAAEPVAAKTESAPRRRAHAERKPAARDEQPAREEDVAAASPQAAPRVWRNNIWLVVFTLAYSGCLLSHAAGLVMSLAYVVTLVFYFCSTAPSLGAGSVLKFVGKNAVLIAVLIAWPVYALVLQPMLFKGNFGNLKGGGDGIMFVPLSYDVRPSIFTYYRMFSWLHFVDIFNSFMVCCPLFVLLPVIVWPLIRQARSRVNWREPWFQFLVIAAAAGFGALSVPLIWQFDFGMWGDWNISGAYLLPMHLFVWIALARFFSSRLSADAWLTGGALVAVQAILALGMLCQLY